MQNPVRVIAYGLAAGGILLASLGAYANHWESQQPIREIHGARVESVRPYFSRGELALHTTTRGYRVGIEGEPRPIDFPEGNWDSTVQPGDSVDMRVRRSFPLFGLLEELDGVSIDDGK